MENQKTDVHRTGQQAGHEAVHGFSLSRGAGPSAALYLDATENAACSTALAFLTDAVMVTA